MPAIKRARGKAFDIKSEVYGSLNPGLRALFMFQVLRGHLGSGVEEPFRGLDHLLCRKGVWQELKNAFRYFGCGDMAELTGELQQIYNELVNGERIVKMERIRLADEQIFKLLPAAEKLAAAYIRNHPEEFEG
jgi:hypothetical protein